KIYKQIFMYQIKRFVFENIKKNIPNFINDLFIKLNTNPSLAFGKEYKKYFDKLVLHNGINPNIEQELLNVVNFTLANSPYYKKIYKEKRINSIEEFKNTIEPIIKKTVLIILKTFKVKKENVNWLIMGENWEGL